jgi:hypothetical protein
MMLLEKLMGRCCLYMKPSMKSSGTWPCSSGTYCCAVTWFRLMPPGPCPLPPFLLWSCEFCEWMCGAPARYSGGSCEATSLVVRT